VPERCNFDAAGNEALDAHGAAFRGVRRSRNKWRAVISVDGQPAGRVEARRPRFPPRRSSERRDVGEFSFESSGSLGHV
jgi:hypothetical protein